MLNPDLYILDLMRVGIRTAPLPEGAVLRCEICDCRRKPLALSYVDLDTGGLVCNACYNMLACLELSVLSIERGAEPSKPVPIFYKPQ